MANSDLIGKMWKIPDPYLAKLREKLNNHQGDKHVEGYTRLQNLLQNGKISYENLKNVKHILDKNIKNETIYELNGGKDFHRWINDQLSVARNSIESGKKIQKDVGVNNAYKKTHEKDSTNKGKVRTARLDKSTSSKDIYNNNVNYESVQKCKVKILLSESQYNTLFSENKLSTVNCDCCQYFDFESLMQYGGFENPIYHLINKRESNDLQFMSPDDYIKSIAKATNLSTSEMISPNVIRQSAVDKYADLMQNGTKFPIGFYTIGKPKQEGRHRALAAKKLGCASIPVVRIVTDIKSKDVEKVVRSLIGKSREEVNQMYVDKGFKGITDLDWRELNNYQKYYLNQ